MTTSTMTSSTMMETGDIIASNATKQSFNEKYEELVSFFINNFDQKKNEFYQRVEKIATEEYTKYKKNFSSAPEEIVDALFERYPTTESLKEAITQLLTRCQESVFCCATIQTNCFEQMNLLEMITQVLSSLTTNKYNEKKKEHILEFFVKRELYPPLILFRFLWALLQLAPAEELQKEYSLDYRESQLFIYLVLFTPFLEESILHTKRTINFSAVLSKVLPTRTAMGKEIIEEESMPFFLHGAMAKSIINERMLFMVLIAKHKKLGEELRSVFSDIISVSTTMNSEKFLRLKAYLSSFIPNELFFGKKAPLFLYAMKSILQQYKLGLMQFSMLLFTDYACVSRSETHSYTLTKKFFFGPYLRFFGKKSEKSDWDNHYNFTDWQEQSKRVGNNTFFGLYTMPLFYASCLAINDMYIEYEMCSGLYKSALGIYDIMRYMGLAKKLLLLSKKMLSIIKEIYQEEGISECCMPLALRSANELFYQKKQHRTFIKKIENWGTGILGTIKCIASVIAPGIIAKFYFNEVEESETLQSIYRFVGAVDATLAKLDALLSEKEQYCLPQVLTEEESAVTISIDSLWYPHTLISPVQNTVRVGGSTQKNMLISGPNGSGKTVFLSSLLTNIILANMGIALGSAMKYTYFSAIYERIKTTYEVGEGSSGGIEEIRRMIDIQNAVSIAEAFGINYLVIIDEIYTKTKESNAIRSALRDLPSILANKHIITFFSTHHTKIIPIFKKFGVTLFYFEVIEQGEGNFVPTYKLREDREDGENWWARDDEASLEKQYRYDLFLWNTHEAMKKKTN